MTGLVTLLIVWAAQAAVAGGPADARVRDAVVAAVRDRMGADVAVGVDELRVSDTVAGAAWHAVPEPGASLGRPIRFTLRQSAAAGDTPGAREGWASAVVHVTVAHAHAARVITRGAAIAGADVEMVSHPIAAGPIRPLSAISAARAGRALRDFAPGDCLARAGVVVEPAVRSGDQVVATARVAGARVSATMIARQSGEPGTVIRVVNPESRRARKARVIAAGQVEIIHD